MPYYPKTDENMMSYDSPSGTINITKWVPPFQDVEGGYGFVGVVAEDTETGKLQCHVCGEWFEQLPSHYSQKHDMTGEEYREAFGLLSSTALKSKKIRVAHSKTIKRLQKEGKMQVGNSNGYGFKKRNKEAGNRKGRKKAVESQNRYGVCDLQVVDKILKLADKLGKTPSLIDIQKEYGGGMVAIIHNRYKSYIDLCRNINLEPLTSSHNPKYSKEYFVKKGINAVMAGKPLVAKNIFSISESRHIYSYFGSGSEWKNEVEKVVRGVGVAL